MAAYTTSDLISDVKLRAFVPTSQSTFSEADILLIADAEMQSTILPLVLDLGNEYYITYKDVAVTANLQSYDIPPRAVGMKLDRVVIINSSGNIRPLSQMAPIFQETTVPSQPENFFLQRNQICLYPVPDGGNYGTLRQYYFLRPGKLVLTSAATTITAVDTTTNTVTIGSVPSSWSTSNTFDLIRQDGGVEQLSVDLGASSVSASAITFTASLPTGLRAGDYVSLSGESPLPQMPAELRPVLAQGVAARIRQAMRLPGADDAMKLLEREMNQAKLLLAPRVESSPKVIMAAHDWL